VGEQKAKYANIVRYGTPTGSRESGNIEREGPQGTSSQPGALERPGSAGFLRAGVPGLPVGLQPSAEPQEDTDSCAGVEATLEMV